MGFFPARVRSADHTSAQGGWAWGLRPGLTDITSVLRLCERQSHKKCYAHPFLWKGGGQNVSMLSSGAREAVSVVAPEASGPEAGALAPWLCEPRVCTVRASVCLPSVQPAWPPLVSGASAFLPVLADRLDSLG